VKCYIDSSADLGRQIRRTSFLERESKKTSHREEETGTTDWRRKQEIKDSCTGVSPTFLKSKGDVSASTNKSEIKM